MAEADCWALLKVVQAFLRSRPHSTADLADLFDLLGRLTIEEKGAFWAWLRSNAPNVRKWLMAKGGNRRAA
jgi:hypothetical protein